MISDPNRTLGNLIDKQKVAFISSIDELGFPTMKAMNAPKKRVGLKEFYFVTTLNAKRTLEYRKNPKASIYFYDRTFLHGIMLSGYMEIIEDDAMIKKYFHENDYEVLNHGSKYEHLCILKFVSISGRYYGNNRAENFIVE